MNIYKAIQFSCVALFLCLFYGVNVFAETNNRIVISISKQQLYLYEGETLLKTFPISTGRFGAGNSPKTGRTPLGKHIILDKLGKDAPKGTIFNEQGRSKRIKKNLNSGAAMTSRLLKLRGLTKENKTTEQRGIFIHGTSAEHRIGKAVSNGCIRMKNDHIIYLFDQVKIGTPVEIKR
jgi:lipoprotein-anchoring transpeptidase ErfK/SrfK